VTDIDRRALAATANGTCLVTGGAGFIGTAMSAGLVERFARVVAVDNLHPQIHPTAERPADLAERVELVVGDVTDPEMWDTLLADVSPDVVVHLAAETGTGQSLTESTRHALTNVVGTTQLLDALLRHSALPRRIVLSSSRAVYGEGAWRREDTGELFYPGQRTAEILERAEWDFPGAVPVAMSAATTTPAPVSVYGATKLAQENLLTAWAQSFGVEPVILRLQNVYGPGQSLINPYTGIMSLFCRLAKAGESIPLYEDGEVRRDFVLIDDVARALVAATTAEAPGRLPIDIGSGEDQTIARAAELIAEHYGAPAPHVTGQYRQGDVRHAWADVGHAAEALGWTPQFSLGDGVHRLASWIDARQAR
jgi:dTDP-L-rhamnose 4-epimerase